MSGFRNWNITGWKWRSTFRNVDPDAFRVRMSRASPGRYAVHEFAKNIFSIAATNGRGDSLPVRRVDADEWQVTGHDGTVRVVYRIFGDFIDGTYMAVDTTHAHLLNMPAAFVWAPGLCIRALSGSPSAQRPAGRTWPLNCFDDGSLDVHGAEPAVLSRQPRRDRGATTSAFSCDRPHGATRRIRVMVHGGGYG